MEVEGEDVDEKGSSNEWKLMPAVTRREEVWVSVGGMAVSRGGKVVAVVAKSGVHAMCWVDFWVMILSW